MFCFNQFGDLERATLREGNVHSADDWRSVLEPVVARYRDEKLRRFFRGDAAFANPDVYSFLEQEGFLYVIRLPANRGAAARDRAPADAPRGPSAEEAGRLVRELLVSCSELASDRDGVRQSDTARRSDLR